jgi:hypothetical protein
LGCTKQAYLTLQQQEVSATPDLMMMPPTMKVPISPVSIGIKADDKIVMIDQGTPLPAMASHEFAGGSVDIWQLEPTEKKLATLEEVDSCTLRVQLSAQGKLWIWVNGESLLIG